MKSRTLLPVLFCGIAVLTIYAVDWFHLIYRLTPWERLEAMTVIPAQIIYFVADTPNIIGYVEQETGSNITCALAVVYVETKAGETYRCCNTEERTSCLAGDFTAEIPSQDPACTDRLKMALGVQDYEAYGDCTDGGNLQLTVVRVDASNQIQWKTVSGSQLQVINGILRCILGPALILLAARVFYTSRKKPDPNRQVRRW